MFKWERLAPELLPSGSEWQDQPRALPWTYEHQTRDYAADRRRFHGGSGIRRDQRQLRRRAVAVLARVGVRDRDGGVGDGTAVGRGQRAACLRRSLMKRSLTKS